MTKTEPKWTPGPWEVDELHEHSSYATAIRANWHGGSKTVAYVEGPGISAKRRDRKELGLANARLIAQAPTMYEALAEVEQNMKNDVFVDPVKRQMYLAAIRPVLAAADGRGK